MKYGRGWGGGEGGRVNNGPGWGGVDFTGASLGAGRASVGGELLRRRSAGSERGKGF